MTANMGMGCTLYNHYSFLLNINWMMLGHSILGFKAIKDFVMLYPSKAAFLCAAKGWQMYKCKSPYICLSTLLKFRFYFKILFRLPDVIRYLMPWVSFWHLSVRYSYLGNGWMNFNEILRHEFMVDLPWTNF